MADMNYELSDYNSSGKKRAELEVQRVAVQQNRFDNVLSDSPQQGMSITDTDLGTEGRLDGLERAKLLTGQNLAEIGQDYQQAYGNIKKRVNQSDTGSELLRANKAGAIADTKNQLQASGVKGGSAVGATSAVERAKSYDTNNLLLQNQRQAETDYMNAAKNNANFTQSSEMNYGALAKGDEYQAPAQNSNGFGTVICTELFKQGYYTIDVFIKDQQYGEFMQVHKPYVYWGYRLWADPVVYCMKKSKLFTKFISLVAVPWAKDMAGEKNAFGSLISTVGEPICGLIGRLYFWGAKYAN